MTNVVTNVVTNVMTFVKKTPLGAGTGPSRGELVTVKVCLKEMVPKGVIHCRYIHKP